MSMYQPGDTIDVDLVYKDRSGNLSDPTTITVKVMDPSGTVTTYTYAAGDVTRVSAGTFRYVVQVPDAAASVGAWRVKAASTGTPRQVIERSFSVEASGVGYAS